MKERYALVKFQSFGFEYTYKCDKNVKRGNVVKVPVEGERELKEVIVSKIKYLTEDELPVPKERIKTVDSVVSEKDVDNRFCENLDELYAFKKDKKAEINWKIKKFSKWRFLNGLPYKYTFLNRHHKTRLHLFGDGENFIIDCHS